MMNIFPLMGVIISRHLIKLIYNKKARIPTLSLKYNYKKFLRRVSRWPICFFFFSLRNMAICTHWFYTTLHSFIWLPAWRTFFLVLSTHMRSSLNEKNLNIFNKLALCATMLTYSKTHSTGQFIFPFLIFSFFYFTF